MTTQTMVLPETDRLLQEPMTDRALRVLTFTTIFPNSAQPQHGLFVRRRVEAMARQADVQVMAPVPWSPPIGGLPARFYRCATVPGRDMLGSLTVHHPRFATIPSVLKSTDPLLMALSCLPSVRALRRTFPFDVIDAHWACPDGVAAGILAGLLGVPFTVTVRGDDLNIFARESGRRRMIAWALKRASRVIAVSRDLGETAVGLGAPVDRVAVVANGVDTALFCPVERPAARCALGLPPDGRLLLSVGRLHTSKGYPMLVEALARLGPRFSDVRLVIIGEPDSEADATPAIREAAERLGVAQRVEIRGAETPERVALWYNAADLFCLATTREGSANVLIESLACGTPCITTAVGGNVESVEHGVSGLFAEIDAGAFAGAILDAFSRRWNRALVRRKVVERSWDSVGAACVGYLRAVAQQGSRP